MIRRFVLAPALAAALVLGLATPTLPAFTPLSDAAARALIDRSTAQVVAFGCDFARRDGTGVAIAGAGIITAQHVAGRSRLIDVAATDHATAEATVTLDAPAADLSTIGVNAGLIAMPLAHGDPAPGAQVWAAGFPGTPPGVRPPGLVVDDLRVIDYVAGGTIGVHGEVMRLSGPVRDGMSGGPVLDSAGAVAGMLFGNEMPQGDAVAIPASQLRPALAGALSPQPC